MRLSVLHRTKYEYASPVRESFNEARLRPVTNEHQTCENHILKILPAARLSHYQDFHANIVHYFEINEPHTTLLVESTSRVRTRDIRLAPEATPVPMESMAGCARMERCFDFLQDSTYVERSPEAWRMALDVTHTHSDAWQAAQAIMDHTHRFVAYMPNTTSVHTHMREVIQDRRGVCQDLAHLMIGLCRAVGIPALYVSGYLYNGPSDSLLGAQASHAWCEVFLPGIGWRGLDPTNNQQPDERYVKIAIGADYADVPPLRGHYKGTTDRKMQVEVLLELIE